jgi:uncharacterized protein YbjT (DUF2867 family)
MILVTGATGNVGGEVLRQLAARGERVRAMTRRPETSGFPKGVEVVRGDFDDPDSVGPAFAGIERLFFMSAQAAGSKPAPTHEHVAASSARTAGVRHIVKLSVLGGGGTDLDDPITRWHHAAEAAIRTSGVDWTFLRPGRFMSNALQWAPMIKSGGKVRIAFASRPAAAIDPGDIAAAAVCALTKPGHAGKAYELSGPEVLTPAHELEILGKVLGRKLELIALSDDAAREGMLRMGMSEATVAATLRRVAASTHGTEILPAVRQLTGRAPHTFAEWAEAHIGAFR